MATTTKTTDNDLGALYLRISDDREGKAAGVARQEEDGRELAEALGIRIHRIYCDNDTGASTLSRKPRPDYEQMLTDIEAGKITKVIAYTTSRLTRRPSENLDLIDLAKATGVEYRFVKSPRYDLTTAAGRKAFRDANSTDTAESEVIGERVARKRAQSAELGKFGGGRRPYGFGVDIGEDPKTKKRVIDYAAVVPEEAEEIRKAAAAVLSGVSLRSIVSDMNQRGVPTVKGGKWSAVVLRDVLIRPRNSGIAIYRGEEVGRLPGKPILPEDVWRSLAAKLLDPERVTNQHGRAPRWLGSNLYRCVCGSVMEIQRGKGRTPAYRCAGRAGTGDVHARRNAVELDGYVATLVIDRLGDDDAVDLVAKPDTGIDVAALQDEEKTLREMLDEFVTDRAEGKITRAQLLAGTDRVNAKLAVIREQLSRTVEVSPLADLVGAEDVAAAWEMLSLGMKRAVVDRLMTVTILPATRKGSGFDSAYIKVEWKH